MDRRICKPVSHPMPEIAAFVANMKAVFGEREIDEAIRRSKAGEPTVYACENSRTAGTLRPSKPTSGVLTGRCVTVITVLAATVHVLAPRNRAGRERHQNIRREHVSIFERGCNAACSCIDRSRRRTLR